MNRTQQKDPAVPESQRPAGFYLIFRKISSQVKLSNLLPES